MKRLIPALEPMAYFMHDNASVHKANCHQAPDERRISKLDQIPEHLNFKTLPGPSYRAQIVQTSPDPSYRAQIIQTWPDPRTPKPDQIPLIEPRTSKLCLPVLSFSTQAAILKLSDF
jgi:hypothetical protein